MRYHFTAVAIVSILGGVVSLATAQAVRPAPAGPAHRLQYRWVRVGVDMTRDDSVAKAIALIERAAKAGFNGIALSDSSFTRLDKVTPAYVASARRVRAACRTNAMGCFVSVIPMGNSSTLLGLDPNLAAALPVKDAPYVVRGGNLMSDDDVRLVNGGFETVARDGAEGWQRLPRGTAACAIDTAVACEGKASLRVADVDRHSPSGEAQMVQTLKVRPFSYYHVSALVKTQNFTATDYARISVTAVRDGTRLCYYRPDIQPTQDWKVIHITFNTLEYDQVTLGVGCPYSAKGGTIWFDDVRLASAGLVNVVRRGGAPLSVTSRDGKMRYVEGRDFTGAADALLGMSPYAGSYSIWHRPPVPAVPAGSRLREGDRVAMSYYHTAIIGTWQVTADMSEPKVMELLDAHVARVRDLMAPDGYFMQHDEIRVQGWEPAFETRKLTSGDVLAENIRSCAGIIRKRDPGKPMFVWSDMFDPTHNARTSGRYYLVKGAGPWRQSWRGLPKDVIVMNWYSQKEGRSDSLGHFSQLGNRQMLSVCYDSQSERDQIPLWLSEAAGVKGLCGVMYTTWTQRFDDLENLLPAARAAWK
ncbi:MAG: hypothetical protein LLG01_06780 [Planctomycetaceae bacterium]|nr:hypothetical protein [Planctomycetaceae bacterium]